MAMIDTLQDHPFRADAEPYECVPASTEDEGFLFFRGLVVGLALSVCLYAGLGALLSSVLN
jgi:hypothetical protein